MRRIAYIEDDTMNEKNFRSAKFGGTKRRNEKWKIKFVFVKLQESRVF